MCGRLVVVKDDFAARKLFELFQTLAKHVLTYHFAVNVVWFSNDTLLGTLRDSPRSGVSLTNYDLLDLPYETKTPLYIVKQEASLLQMARPVTFKKHFNDATRRCSSCTQCS
ncbi:hypothetical protein EVAR_98741_1 [Eumeta japonica]|uniref:Uncharacterized protein n=1 Tax=Eumeta variegata TaxID=151549 RepID=A0A4C1YSZ7_EUMVA|nr:hypothetical protein EVAR_98741_1 [Eumeta japonica]